MLITKDSAVQFHYILSEAGKEIESSFDDKPLVYLHGHGGIFPALEEALEGKGAGEKLEVTLTPEQSYGYPREGSIQRIPIKHLQVAGKLQVGATALVESNQGRQEVTIVKLGKFNADCDLNHPFAGKTLTFTIQVVNVREGTAEEISHGHVHAAGGCGHDH
ncbi:peptidylprolyl isomerase [Psychromonas sp. psych-6C06]|uniref:FKBP-type peptidyl-prolyl cis-trans isomerase n=1 Tax=Psychromonas sp. psych-6C06 TaxID=2058089 RepID=UPI000C3292B9|nr:peptidylprolyl isomerase [Psychromonas sp. psych-6C06]PKF63802.1 peptidylprolyl isomerase [Psychromonas sp. psych-6C06]